MAKRPISVDLLNLTIEQKLDQGVSEADIRRLIYAFTLDTPEAEPGDDTIGFLWVDDIADMHRGEFLTVLLALSPETEPMEDRRAQPAQQPGYAVTMWQKAVAALKAARSIPVPSWQ